MSQLLALEWDSSEVRLAVASSRGDRAVIEQAFSIALGSEEPGAGRPEKDLGARIAAALGERGIGRLDALVAIGRTNIELRQLSLPPVPDDELPGVVRFQAMREFNALDEDWLLDFIPLDTPAEGPRSVLAAAIDPDLVGQIQKTCETAGVKPQRLILRPCGAASLFGRAQPAGAAQLRLLVDLLADEADLTVMIDRRVVFLRTTRLPEDPLQGLEQAAALLGEIRRTMAAAMNQLGGQPVESIVLCGKGEQHAALAKVLEENLGTPTSLFDPFAGLRLGRELRDALPEHSGRFAPLLGMLLAEFEQTGHAIDFLHPRHRPQPPSRRKLYAALAAAVGVFLLGWLAWGRIERLVLQANLRDLDRQIEQLKAENDRAKKLVATAGEIEKWTATDLPWLDVFDRLSQRFPPKKEALVTSLNFAASKEASVTSAKSAGKTARSGQAGAITLQGAAQTSETISRMEKDIGEREKEIGEKNYTYTVAVTQEGTKEEKKSYPQQFRATVTINSEKPQTAGPEKK